MCFDDEMSGIYLVSPALGHLICFVFRLLFTLSSNLFKNKKDESTEGRYGMMKVFYSLLIIVLYVYGFLFSGLYGGCNTFLNNKHCFQDICSFFFYLHLKCSFVIG